MYELTPIEKTSDVFLAKHYIDEPFVYFGEIFSTVTPGASLLLLCFFLYSIYLIFDGPISWLMGKVFKSFMIDAMEITEDIDIYTNCLDENDRRWTV